MAVRFTITAEGKGAEQAVKRLGRKFRGLDKTTKQTERSSNRSIKKMVAGYATLGLGIGSVLLAGRRLGRFVADSVRAAGVQAQAEAKRRAALEASGQATEDVIAIYNRFLEGFRQEPILLGQTLKTMQKETIKNDYIYLKGHYHMYHYWKSGDVDDTGKVRRNLVEIYELDENRGLMHCRIMISPRKNLKREDWWLYEGWVFNIKNKLFWLFECVQGMLPEIGTMIIFKPSFWPDPHRFFLYGIISALSLEGMPCASNVILEQIKPDDALIDNLGYFSPEEIKAEGHGVNILDYINNEIKNTYDIMRVKAKG